MCVGLDDKAMKVGRESLIKYLSVVPGDYWERYFMEVFNISQLEMLTEANKVVYERPQEADLARNQS